MHRPRRGPGEQGSDGCLPCKKPAGRPGRVAAIRGHRSRPRHASADCWCHDHEPRVVSAIRPSLGRLSRRTPLATSATPTTAPINLCWSSRSENRRNGCRVGHHRPSSVRHGHSHRRLSNSSKAWRAIAVFASSRKKSGDRIAGSPRFLTTHGYVHAPEEQMPMMRVYQSSSSQNRPFLDTTPLWSSKAPSPTPAPGRGGVSVLR
jgi:hypothetical protein